ncbi:FATC domain [Dillenia turbinata]|uniref:FATC domain n=1 Tax=Dillenia turbinata TaxID=194707 RepID=A0AAN8Z4R2_9MAGN
MEAFGFLRVHFTGILLFDADAVSYTQDITEMQQYNNTASAFDAAKDVMEALRGKHTNLAGELEYPTATTAEVPQSLKKELFGVCRACFSADAENKHVEFVREYKQDFDRDLDPESTTIFPATLSELTKQLKHWKNILQRNVEDRIPAVLKLEDESKVLRDFYIVDVEEIAPDHTVKLDGIGADIPIIRIHGSSFWCLTLIGSDGSQKHFIVQISMTPNVRSDECILQLFCLMNPMFDKHKESRRRHISVHTPIIIPVWSQPFKCVVGENLQLQTGMPKERIMKLLSFPFEFYLFIYIVGHLHEFLNPLRNDREADLPITYFKEQLNQAISGQISPEAVMDLRLQAYNDITKTYVSDGILSQYMYKTLLSGKQMWAFEKQFAIQLALSSFITSCGFTKGGSLNPAEFKSKVTTNVEHVIKRINNIAPQCLAEEVENAVDLPQSMQRFVTKLVEAALSPKHLCMMDPTWHPWF